MESFRRDLSNDMAEHRPILKNSQNTYTPILVSHPKQVQPSPKRVFCFYCVNLLVSLSISYRPAIPFGNKKTFILKDLFSAGLCQFKKYHPHGNLKLNNLHIFESLKVHISMEKSGRCHKRQKPQAPTP